ncbi:hypothetical protein NDU88_004154 [Pleurodeles waltl]|uniref:Uncharacterized protein n=1 Tax=Pleurodeles waltl TaxID=8319 RepID=A0AAV7W877_PLEWA|nr:hypothetical protein NDU88_004154 [Pleurodeles waltl]
MCSAPFASWHRGLPTDVACTPGTAQQWYSAQCKGKHFIRDLLQNPTVSCVAAQGQLFHTCVAWAYVPLTFVYSWSVVMVEPRLVWWLGGAGGGSCCLMGSWELPGACVVIWRCHAGCVVVVWCFLACRSVLSRLCTLCCACMKSLQGLVGTRRWAVFGGMVGL